MFSWVKNCDWMLRLLYGLAPWKKPMHAHPIRIDYKNLSEEETYRTQCNTGIATQGSRNPEREVERWRKCQGLSQQFRQGRHPRQLRCRRWRPSLQSKQVPSRSWSPRHRRTSELEGVRCSVKRRLEDMRPPLGMGIPGNRPRDPSSSRPGGVHRIGQLH